LWRSTAGVQSGPQGGTAALAETYFVHQFKPKFIEAGLLSEPETLAMVTRTNRQIHQLAPVLNSPSIAEGAAVESSPPHVPVEVLTKRHGGAVYVFAVGMRDGQTSARIRVAGLKGRARAEVLGEGRGLEVTDGAFRDTFKPWDVHLYKIAAE